MRHLPGDRWHNQLSRRSRRTTQYKTVRSGSRKPSTEYLMINIRELRNVIIVLLASSMMLAQSDSFRVKPQIDSSAPDIRQIVESSIAATQRHWQERLRSTYVQRDENRHLDSAGRVKSPETEREDRQAEAGNVRAAGRTSTRARGAGLVVGPRSAQGL
jgi:hypothetical protein